MSPGQNVRGALSKIQVLLNLVHSILYNLEMKGDELNKKTYGAISYSSDNIQSAPIEWHWSDNNHILCLQHRCKTIASFCRTEKGYNLFFYLFFLCYCWRVHGLPVVLNSYLTLCHWERNSRDTSCLFPFWHGFLFYVFFFSTEWRRFQREWEQETKGGGKSIKPQNIQQRVSHDIFNLVCCWWLSLSDFS